MEKLKSTRRYLPQINLQKERKNKTFSQGLECWKTKTIFLKRDSTSIFFLYTIFPLQSYCIKYKYTAVYIPLNKWMQEKNVWLKLLGDGAQLLLD